MTFEEFYSKLNLEEYPFSTFTTENEKGKEKILFSTPSNYSTLLQAFEQNSSVLLIGERGIGKTAILLDFERSLNNGNDISVKVDDYSALSEEYTSIELYKFLLQRITIKIFNKLASEKSRIKKLSYDEKLLLSYLLKEYVPTYSKRNLKSKIEQIQIPFWKRTLIKIGNGIRPIFNYTATAGSIMLDDFIAKHFKGLPPIAENINIKDYFPEIPSSVEQDFESPEVCYQFLDTCLNIFKKMEFGKISVFLDKMDEDQRLQNNGELIGQFIKNILTDNKLLLNQDMQIIISLWQTPFNYIKDDVRTQKHFCPILNWDKLDIENALNKRLGVFSNNKIKNYKSIFCENINDHDFNQIIRLSNKNPRDLWHVMDIIFKEQFKIDPNSNCIKISTLKPAFENFVKHFNYYEYYPKKLNSRANSMDFYSYVSYLLKLDSPEFTKNKLNDQAGTGGSTNNYVIGMERIGLIENISQSGGVVQYRIKDPKVVYALENVIKIEKS